MTTLTLKKPPRVEILTGAWPLAIGIQAELFKALPDGVSRTEVRKAMSAWCGAIQGCLTWQHVFQPIPVVPNQRIPLRDTTP